MQPALAIGANATRPPHPAAGAMGVMRYDFGPQRDPNQEAEHAKQLGDNLGQVLSGRWSEWRDARRQKEDEWVEDLLAYNGIYDSTTLARIGPHRSRVFVQLTRTKTKAAYSRLIDMLFQPTSAHWDIEPTPVPDLETGLRLVDPQTGQEIVLTAEDVAKIAKKANDGMRKEIKDSLVQANYDTHMKSAIHEQCALGTGCIKGVTVKTDFRKRWGPGQQLGTWQIYNERTAFPSLYAPSIFNIYPDPWATSMEDCIGVFERHVLTCDKVRELAKFEGFQKDRIERAIADHPNGNHVDETHEIERKRIAKNDSAQNVSSGRFDVLEYWGTVSGRELQAAGMQVQDETQDYNVCAFVVGAYTIKLMFNPLMPERIPYHLFPYHRSPHTIWGEGVPREMRDSQIVLNTAYRVMLDNMALSSGPQIEINMDLMAPGQNPQDIIPWGIWYREGGDPNSPMIRVHKMDNITAPLVQVIDLSRRFADEETSLPSYTHGEMMPGLNKTASGMSMLMTASNVVLKAVVKNIDDFAIEPIIGSMYDWHMRWNPKPEIKGDLTVKARGSQALMAKEVMSQRLLDLLTRTNNPVDFSIMGPVRRAELLREAGAATDIDPDKVAPDADELTAQAAQSGPSGPGTAPDTGRGGSLPPGGGGSPGGMAGRFGVPDPATGAMP